MAPVSVATSSRCVAPSRRAYHIASASTRRPSASVFVISIVFPFAARRMSPGRNEVPLTRFSAAATTVRIRTCSSSSAIAAVAAITAAPPAMSPFMSYIFSAGFREIPPASNVIALPTRPTTRSLFASAGS